MSEITQMQQKTINFSQWIVSLIDKIVPDTEESNGVRNTVGEYFKTTENYNHFMFCILPSLCNNPGTAKHISKIRSLKNEEERKEAIYNAKKKLSFVNSICEKAFELPEDELDALVLKLSLYVNLFTDMYWQ
jgi:hypothetical protein